MKHSILSSKLTLYVAFNVLLNLTYGIVSNTIETPEATIQEQEILLAIIPKEISNILAQAELENNLVNTYKFYTTLEEQEEEIALNYTDAHTLITQAQNFYTNNDLIQEQLKIYAQALEEKNPEYVFNPCEITRSCCDRRYRNLTVNNLLRTGNLDVLGNENIRGKLTVHDLDITGALKINGVYQSNINLGSTQYNSLNSSGNTTVTSLTASGSITSPNANLGTATTGTIVNSGNLSVAGNTTLNTLSAEAADINNTIVRERLVVGDNALVVNSTTTRAHGRPHVGIGVADPVQALEVAGDGTFFGSLTTQSLTTNDINVANLTTDNTISGDSLLVNNATITASTQTGTLNTSGQAILNSAIITNNLAVDDTTFFVDSINNRVGVGTATPTQALEVIGDTTISGTLTVGALDIGAISSPNIVTPGNITSTGGNISAPAGTMSAVDITATNSISGPSANITAITTQDLTTTGATRLSALGIGVLHANNLGLLSSELITNVDIASNAAIDDTKLNTINTPLKVSNSATTATAATIGSTIVARDASGNFSAGTITATLDGNAATATSATTATTATNATNFTGSLTGDVTGTQGATVVSLVGGETAANVATATTLANAATDANTASTIVRRDASGNFAAGTITAALAGNATTATNTTNFTGSLAGDVTGTQVATVVATVGGQTAANVATATTLANAATDANTASAIVRRDASGNFAAGTITATLDGNAATATSATTAITATNATNFTGSLTGDVTGTQGATVVSLVGGQTAANVATATTLANAATDANTASAIVRRDASGDFAAGTITASLTGAASLNVLKTGDTMTGTLALTPSTGNALTASGPVAITGSTAGNTLSVTGNVTAAATIAQITATNNQIGLQVTGNGTGTGLQVSGNTGAGTGAVVSTADGTGTALAITGNTTAAAATITAGAGTSSLLISDGTAAVPSIGFNADATSGLYRIGASSLGIATAGINRAIFDTNGGRLTSNYRAQVYVSADVTTSAITTTIPFNAENLDPANSFDITAFNYTAPVTGVYFVAVQASIEKNATAVTSILDLKKNTVSQTGYLIQAAIPISTAGTMTMANIILLNAGDTVSIDYTGSTGDIIRGSATNMSIHLLSI